MPLRISPSKKPLPVGKQSSLRNKSYEVIPAPGRKVYLSDNYPTPARPPPLSDQEVFALQRSNKGSNSQFPPDSASLTWDFGRLKRTSNDGKR